ncbi:peptide/nickel transport system permease protein [Bradyrhizobium sp. F1.4.3]|uniref:ABC transporter permease n=1 Tax=Bradyrhizobium sp. F1.4.3 TaxID=3156356 RepID=UPI00339ACD06
MVYYVFRRLLMLPPVMLIVAFIVFGLLYVTPGDPAAMIAGDQATPEEVERIRVSMGLDQPFYIRFAFWIWQLMNGDLGTSIFANQPVVQMIGQRIGPTFSLLTMSLAISVAIAVPVGVVAAWQRGHAIDRVITALTVLAFSLPVFVVGYLLAFSFSTSLGLLPAQGYVPLADGFLPYISHLILPSLTLGVSYSAILARTTRASMLDVLTQDYVRTAVAKGAGPRIVLYKHALRNASIPIVTVISIGIATLMGGSVITESVFSIPGLGRLTLDAILHRDYPVIQGVVLLFSASYVAINLITDLAYTIVDPRIRY